MLSHHLESTPVVIARASDLYGPHVRRSLMVGCRSFVLILVRMLMLTLTLVLTLVLALTLTLV